MLTQPIDATVDIRQSDLDAIRTDLLAAVRSEIKSLLQILQG